MVSKTDLVSDEARGQNFSLVTHRNVPSIRQTQVKLKGEECYKIMRQTNRVLFFRLDPFQTTIAKKICGQKAF